jgi:hypothetical protein
MASTKLVKLTGTYISLYIYVCVKYLAPYLKMDFGGGAKSLKYISYKTKSML